MKRCLLNMRSTLLTKQAILEKIGKMYGFLLAIVEERRYNKHNLNILKETIAFNAKIVYSLDKGTAVKQAVSPVE